MTRPSSTRRARGFCLARIGGEPPGRQSHADGYACPHLGHIDQLPVWSHRPTQLALVSDLQLRALLSRWPGAYAEFKEEEDAIAALIPSVLANVGTQMDLSALDGRRDAGDRRPPPDVEEIRRELTRTLAVPAVRSTLTVRYGREANAARDGGRLLELVDQILTAIRQNGGD